MTFPSGQLDQWLPWSSLPAVLLLHKPDCIRSSKLWFSTCYILDQSLCQYTATHWDNTEARIARLLQAQGTAKLTKCCKTGQIRIMQTHTNDVNQSLLWPPARWHLFLFLHLKSALPVLELLLFCSNWSSIKQHSSCWYRRDLYCFQYLKHMVHIKSVVCGWGGWGGGFWGRDCKVYSAYTDLSILFRVPACRALAIFLTQQKVSILCQMG